MAYYQLYFLMASALLVYFSSCMNHSGSLINTAIFNVSHLMAHQQAATIFGRTTFFWQLTRQLCCWWEASISQWPSKFLRIPLDHSRHSDVSPMVENHWIIRMILLLLLLSLTVLEIMFIGDECCSINGFSNAVACPGIIWPLKVMPAT